jgi:hypothetical protein
MNRKLLLLLPLAGLLLADTVAGLKWTPPAGWTAQGQRPMRAATYSVPPAAGDKDAGECAVYFFGEGQGGGIQANLQRWQGQFSAQTSAPKSGKKTVNGMTVTTLDVSGTYAGMAGPMSGGGAPKAGYRMLCAIVEAPGGNVFFKFTGPAKTVAANQAKFDQMIASVAK